MSEINERKAESDAAENQQISKLFYRLAVVQIVQILIGTILGFFVAPASLFVSRTENEAFRWIAAAFAGFALIALGVILIVLSIVAAIGFRREKSWRNFIGIATAGTSVLAFPFGTIAGGVLLRRIFRAHK